MKGKNRTSVKYAEIPSHRMVHSSHTWFASFVLRCQLKNTPTLIISNILLVIFSLFTPANGHMSAIYAPKHSRKANRLPFICDDVSRYTRMNWRSYSYTINSYLFSFVQILEKSHSNAIIAKWNSAKRTDSNATLPPDIRHTKVDITNAMYVTKSSCLEIR